MTHEMPTPTGGLQPGQAYGPSVPVKGAVPSGTWPWVPALRWKLPAAPESLQTGSLPSVGCDTAQVMTLSSEG